MHMIGASTMELVLGKKHAEFISKYASIDVPKRLETLLKLTELLGMKTLSQTSCFFVSECIYVKSSSHALI